MKERSEQPNHKRNPPMITSAKNYTKKIKNMKWTDRTLGQMVKAKLYKENYTKQHTHTHKKRKRKNIHIYLYIKKRNRATRSINISTNDNKL